MEKTILGRTGLEVTKIAFGGIPIQRLSENDAVDLVKYAIDSGINFYDTANMYTDSEIKMGKAFKGRRDDLVIASKTMDRSAEGALSHVDLSLRQLQTDYIELYQLHNVADEKTMEQVLAPGGAYEGLLKAKEAGKIGYIGVTSHSTEVLEKIMKTDKFDTVQVSFNCIVNEVKDSIFPIAEEKNIGVISMKPLSGGMIGNVKLAIKYLLDFPKIVPDPGFEKKEEIDEIISIFNKNEKLTDEERIELEKLREEIGTQFCRRCDYCQPCPEGISIQTVMYTKSFYQRFKLEFIKPENKFGMIIKKAGDCTECGVCETRCPYKLPIREMLKENYNFWEKVTS